MDLAYWLNMFKAPADPSMLSYGIYDPALVVLSILVAIFASWMGLHMAGQASESRQLRNGILLTGSLALGSGVWAMHFIGMLAFDLCTRVEYDPAITLYSMLPSIAASFVALNLIGRGRLSTWTLLAGGVLVGAGIGAMHYAGMAAMRMSLQLRYDPWMFALSIVVAVVLASLALWVRFGLSTMQSHLPKRVQNLLAAIVMGCAIAGMHYTGMAAARFIGRVAPGETGSSNSLFLALAISLITVAFTVFVLAVNSWLRYRQLFQHLSQSESWMRALLATTVDGVITFDQSGKIRDMNAASERIFGWPRAELLGQSIHVLMDAGADGTDEVMARRRDGSSLPIRRAIGHARLGEEQLSICFVTDISERRAMTSALRASEQQFRTLIANIPGASYRRQMSGAQQLLYLSDAVERLTGYPAADFVGPQPLRNLRAKIHPAERDQVAAAVEHAIAERTPYVVEYRLMHANGSTAWLWENGSPVYADDGSLQFLDGVIFDISERRQMEEALVAAKDNAEQAAAARATFVANMSHEIRTPMNAILGFTDVLLDTGLTPEQRHHLSTVRSAGRALLRLLNEILDTAKLERGAVELELSDYSLLGLIDELSSTMGASARAKGLSLAIHYGEDVPARLRGDALRVRQVLTNLLDNAIKFTHGGRVTLTCRRQDKELYFLVQDTGIGIAADRLEAIFDPFTQADTSMTRRFGGTGLGTTICRQLVTLMGGRIWADSMPGQGTLFHVLLPMDAAADQSEGPAERPAPALPPLRVLAADDVPQNLELLNLMLTRRGHIMVAAFDGAEAQRMALEDDFDLILMDVQMPHVDGLQATRQLRAAETAQGRSRVPVVAMTASVLEEHRRAAQEAGMDGFATKPIEWSTLANEIARVLGLDNAAGPNSDGSAAVAQVLDRAAGLRRWSGQLHDYRAALARFASDFGDAARNLDGLLAAMDFSAAMALAHRARGLAANLGLDQLSAGLHQLEAACAAHDASACSSAQQRLVGDWRRALDAVGSAAPALPEPAAKAAAAAALDHAAVLQAVQALDAALARGALDEALLDRLQGHLGAHAQTELAQLQGALGDFDFVRARTLLVQLMAAVA